MAICLCVLFERVFSLSSQVSIKNIKSANNAALWTNKNGFRSTFCEFRVHGNAAQLQNVMIPSLPKTLWSNFSVVQVDFVPDLFKHFSSKKQTDLQ